MLVVLDSVHLLTNTSVALGLGCCLSLVTPESLRRNCVTIRSDSFLLLGYMKPREGTDVAQVSNFDWGHTHTHKLKYIHAFLPLIEIKLPENLVSHRTQIMSLRLSVNGTTKIRLISMVIIFNKIYCNTNHLQHFNTCAAESVSL
jgi:hypothetical protein